MMSDKLCDFLVLPYTTLWSTCL